MNKNAVRIFIILVLLALVIWINLPNNPGIKIGDFSRSLDTVLGLDLQGGMQVLLEADLPADADVNTEDLQNAQTILENRSNGLGVSEVVFQVAGNRRIVGEFPGLTNTEEVIAVLKETGQLEFVDMGTTILAPGTVILTDVSQAASKETETTPTTESTTSSDSVSTEQEDLTNKIWHTVMTGDQLKSINVTQDQIGKYVVQFELKDQGAKVFKEYTTANVGKVLAIVLDKKIISTPTIENPITDGAGIITGNFTFESANNLAVQLRYGSLPIPFKVVESRVIGPTLGQDSLQKSITAGIIGIIIVALFMTLYYRLPGFVAILSIITYGLITLALFKIIPVTLTLPGIAGVLLSTGGALDANILIFERLKEELRSGRNLVQAVDLSWKRAWSSIRDSNFATLITSGILFWFGSAYGASTVKGFALTLAIGVAISLFCAIIVTRTLLSLALGFFKAPENHMKWFGV
jgi:preprotein translocase subunit SecD